MRFLFVFCLLSITGTGFSQDFFQNISFSDALEKSQKEGKLIFLQFESTECKQCNEVADKGFENSNLAEKLNETFVCIRVSTDHPDREEIGKLYNISKGFGSLFISSDKTLIHKYTKSTTMAAQYISQIDLALTKAGETMKLTELENEYKKANRSPGFMEMYLLKRRTLRLPNDELLDEYVALLPADSLQSIRTLQFIAQMSPILGSKSHEALRKDKALFSKAWNLMPLQQRAAINSNIIIKSRNLAIEQKDETYAKTVASFAQSTYSANYRTGAKAFELNMLEFYKGTGDTTQYFTKAIGYYDRYYMSISVDSIKRIDSLTRARLFAKATSKDTVINGIKTKRAIASPYKPVGQYYTWELKNAAMDFYKMTSNPYLLSVATNWIKRGIEFFETPEALDTYSRLLYKQGHTKTAIEVEQKVIELRKKRGFSTTEYETDLEKMKNGLGID